VQYRSSDLPEIFMHATEIYFLIDGKSSGEKGTAQLLLYSVMRKEFCAAHTHTHHY
jgi:hypothetical protein